MHICTCLSQYVTSHPAREQHIADKLWEPSFMQGLAEQYMQQARDKGAAVEVRAHTPPHDSSFLRAHVHTSILIHNAAQTVCSAVLPPPQFFVCSDCY